MTSTQQYIDKNCDSKGNIKKQNVDDDFVEGIKRSESQGRPSTSRILRGYERRGRDESRPFYLSAVGSWGGWPYRRN